MTNKCFRRGCVWPLKGVTVSSMKLAPLPLVVLLALVSWASGQTTDGQWTYIVENDGATITASTATGVVSIPSVLGGYAVKKVGNSWPPVFGYDNTSVLGVYIPNSVTSVGAQAFQSCTRIAALIIPQSVTSIGGGAFTNCTILQTVYLPTRFANTYPDFGLKWGQAVFYDRDLPGPFYLGGNIPGEWAAQWVKNWVTVYPGYFNTLDGGLYTAARYTANFKDGKDSVLNSPNSYGLYTTSQIQNMAVGDLVLTRQVDGSFVLNYDIEQSEDLVNWTPYQALSLPLTGLPADKAFIRIRAKQ